jgi:hypothetical protein
MKKLKQILFRFWPFITYGVIFIGFFYKSIFLKLLLFPGDLLVARFFPYRSGGWEGATSWIPYKEYISADVVRQLYPWRILAMEQLKNGIIPLWNPYSFSGTPLLANVQSAAFYPINILFFLFHPLVAWNIYILLQPILSFYFMYLFIRSLDLSKHSAFFSAFCFGFIGYLVIWFELGIVGHSALWLPLILWGITMRYKKEDFRYFLFSAVGIGCSLLGGHAQTAIYVLLISFLYYLFLSFKHGVTRLILELWFFLIGVGIAAVQLIPSAELLMYSARNAENSLAAFQRFRIPFYQLLTLFVPDFFGNPATKNFWGYDYSEVIVYFGIVALVFAVIGIVEYWHKTIVRFFLVLGLIALAFSLNTPFADILFFLKIPVLGTALPSRGIFIVMFVMVVLSGFGMESLITHKKIHKTPLAILIVIYFGFGIFYIFSNQFVHLISAENILTAKRNIIVPLLIFSFTMSGIFIGLRFKKTIQFVYIFLILISIFEYRYFFYKYLPLAPSEYVFPKHSFVDYLSATTPPDRVYGYKQASLGTNPNVLWHVLSTEGYDPLYISRYGELLYASDKGIYSSKIPRSDAILPDTFAGDDSYGKRVLLDLLGVTYILDEDPNGRDFVEFEKDYPKENYEYFYRQGKWRVYKNKNVLPRAMIFYNYKTITDNSEIISTLFSKNFDYKSHLILEETPSEVQPQDKEPEKATIINYQSNKISITTNSSSKGLLFLSDVYYPGWHAYVDGKQTSVYRADYAFRAVPIDAGKHTVEFTYQPVSFTIGAVISFISICMVFFLLFTRAFILRLLDRKS